MYFVNRRYGQLFSEIWNVNLIYTKYSWGSFIFTVPCIVTILISSELQHAGVYLLQNYSTSFGCLSHTSSGVHQSVTAASGTGHSFRATTFCQRDLIRPLWRKVVALTLWLVPEDAVTLWCTPDDGCDSVRVA